ncbi:AraC family transcriptional regulator [Marinicaulis flavus]|uniref:AraC family transcriptional regulator n=2 Tax=Hyphococcus luteus TaxID=2058213 RepID=A0A2S7K007_9PROT|nr:AraC family transcriptional regulator [Marinicaulis flavus]
MDVLDDILATLALKGALYFRTQFSAPWATTVPELKGAARFHLIVEGQCHVSVAGGATLTLGAGDLILIPAGRSHILADPPVNSAPPLETVLKDAGYDGEGVFVAGGDDGAAATQMICGHYTFRDGADHPLLRALPAQLVFSAADRMRAPWLDEILRLLARRVFEAGPGAGAAVTRLSEAAFVEMVRAGAEGAPEMKPVLAALADRQIGRTLSLMHARPHEIWTVEGLAGEAGMSRSRYAEKFRALIGMSPLAYLSEWRLQKALALLDNHQCTIQQAAAESGYRSPAAFTRAFTAKFGASPTAYRRQRA